MTTAVPVPFLDVGATYRELHAEIDQAVADVLHSGRYIRGPQVEAFEQEWADYCGARYCVGVGNGLDALHLSLAAFNIGAGDEVIVPSNTFIATWLAVSRTGASPVPVEPDPRTFNIDPARIGDAITERTKAIMPVHLYGQPADLPGCYKHGLPVIADGAQAHGARLRGLPVGRGETTAWSFYPCKNLGCFGDGGAVTTNSPEIARRVRALANYGSEFRDHHDEQGINSRLDEIQAAVLRVTLPHLARWNERRTEIAERYLCTLAGTVTVPVVRSWVQPAWHLFVIRTAQRDALQEYLAERGIETLVHYPIPPHRQDAYIRMHGRNLPIAEHLAREVLSLPIGPHMSDREVDAVIDGVNSL